MDVDAYLPDRGETVLLRPDLRRYLLLLLVSGLFTAAGVWLVYGGYRWLGWACAGFFGLGALVSLVMLLPGCAGLRLSPEGFEILMPFHRSRTGWNEVVEFQVYEVGPTKVFLPTKYVGFRYAEGCGGKAPRLRKLASSLTGVEGGVPDTYGFAAEDLARLLNTWRERYAPSS